MTESPRPIFAYAGLEVETAAVGHARTYMRRVGEMMGAMRNAEGCLWAEATHHGQRERALLSWWHSRNAILEWYEHPAHREIVAYGRTQRELLETGAVRTWIEFYEPVQIGEIAGERAVLLAGAPPCGQALLHRSLRTSSRTLELTWLEPWDVRPLDGLLLRQLPMGVRSSPTAGAPFSKARLLDF